MARHRIRSKGGGGTGGGTVIITPPGDTNVQVSVKPGIAIEARAAGSFQGAEVKPAVTFAPRVPEGRAAQVNPAVDFDATASGEATKPALNPALGITARGEGGTTVAVAPAVDVDLGPTRLVTQQSPALDIDVTASGTLASQALSPALALSLVTALPQAKTDVPAFNLVQTVVTLNGSYPSDAVTQEAVGGRSDWTNPTNAQGNPDTAVAALSSNTLAARSGRLACGFPNMVGKTPLTITKVELWFYVRQAGTLLSNGNLILGHRQGAGAITVLQTFTGNQDSLTTPLVYDITAAIGGDWSKVDALVATIEASLPAAVTTITENADAVLCVVTAERTDVL